MKLLRAALAPALLLAAAAARAQAPPADDVREAALYFQVGQSAYERGRYEEALGHFRRSYDLSHRADLLYNMASCAERLARPAEAAELLRRYLAEKPEASDRPQVTEKIEQLSREAHPPPPTVTAPAVTPPPRPHTARKAAWATGAVAAAFALAAVGTGAWAIVEHGSLADGCGATVGCTPAQADGLHLAAHLTDAFIAVAAAAAVVTVVLLVIDRRADRPRAALPVVRF